jgi:hypothetical protein
MENKGVIAKYDLKLGLCMMNEARQKNTKYFKNMTDNIGMNLCWMSLPVEVGGLNCGVLCMRYLRITE